jgi:hypothetical protein
MLVALCCIPRLANSQHTHTEPEVINPGKAQVLQELGWYFYWNSRAGVAMYSSPLAWAYDAHVPPLQRCPVPIGSSGRVCLGERRFDKGARGPATLVFHSLDTLSHRQPADRTPLTAPAPEPLAPVRLALVADTAADNGWYVGHLMLLSQNVATLGERLANIDRCRANRGWCLALRAFVMDQYSYYREADSLYTLALEFLPGAVACRWRDITPLLDHQVGTAYQDLDCEGRRDLEERFWMLSDPLYMIAGNERRTAHYSRRLLDSLYAGGPSPFDRPGFPMPWTSELATVVLRYGMADLWVTVADGPWPPMNPVSWAVQGTPNFSFVPVGVSFSDDEQISSNDFRIRMPIDSARERYRPDYDFVGDLSHFQVAAFPRGDSMLVAAVLDLQAEPLREAAPFTAAFFMSPSADRAPQVVADTSVYDRIEATFLVPRERQLMSIEVLADTLRIAGRSRFTVEATSARMSDLLLFLPSGDLPKSVEEALKLTIGGPSVDRTKPLGLFWELDTPPGDSATDMQITVRALDPPRGGIIGRIRSLFGGQPNPVALTTSWQISRTRLDTENGQAIALGIGSLKPGEYEVELLATSPDGERLTAARRITVTARRSIPAPMQVALNQPLAIGREGFTHGDPLVRPDRRIVGGGQSDDAMFQAYVLSPYRHWCFVRSRPSRWCERIVDGIVRGG